jgi:hypothetical protein
MYFKCLDANFRDNTGKKYRLERDNVGKTAYTDTNHILCFFYEKYKNMKYIVRIAPRDLPVKGPGSQFQLFHSEFVYIGTPVPVKDFILPALRNFLWFKPYFLNHTKDENVTYDMLHNSCKNFSDGLKYVKQSFHSEKLYLVASFWPESVKYMKNISPLFAEKLMKENMYIFKYLPKELQTRNMCIQALSFDGSLIKYVNEKYQNDNSLTSFSTESLQVWKPLKLRSLAKWTKNRERSFVKSSLSLNPDDLQYIEKQTREMCLIAVKKEGTSLRWVKEQTNDVCLEAVKQDGKALEFVKIQTNEICLEAVKQWQGAIFHVKNQTLNMCKYVRSPRYTVFIDESVGKNLKMHRERLKRKYRNILETIIK